MIAHKKQDEKKARLQQHKTDGQQVKYLVDLWEANISRLESQQLREVWTKIKLVQRNVNISDLSNVNASAMARGQQSNFQKTNFGQILWSLRPDIEMSGSSAIRP